MNLLAIETSCDETCAAVVKDDELLSNVIASQEVHKEFGGVVPELASRAHMLQIGAVVRKAVERAEIDLRQLDAIAVTQGPGLVGSLLVGLNFAKGLAADLGIPLLGINHLEGHLFSNQLMPNCPDPPYLSLIISGGHSILVYVDDWCTYRVLGETQDDAAGEAFDKVAKILDLPYPGGPQIEKMAKNGDPQSIRFPVAKLKDAPFDFSFSGLKTAVLYHVQKVKASNGGRLPEDARADIAASFQHAVIAAIDGTVARAFDEHRVKTVAIAGGVACNQTLRQALQNLGQQLGFEVIYPAPIFCTDNAAMIAKAAMARFRQSGAKIPLSDFRHLEMTPKPGMRIPSISVETP